MIITLHKYQISQVTTQHKNTDFCEDKIIILYFKQK
jgi:hypothetical protein